MKPESSAFSSEPDRAIGAALRAALDQPGEAAFIAVVLDRARVGGVGSSRAVLGRWTWGAAAAAVLAALLGGVLAGTGQGPGPSPSFEASWVTAATGSSFAAALLTAPNTPDASIVFASPTAN